MKNNCYYFIGSNGNRFLLYLVYNESYRDVEADVILSSESYEELINFADSNGYKPFFWMNGRDCVGEVRDKNEK